MKTLLLLTLCLISLPALARLGDTIEESKARFGEPVEVSKDGLTLTFKKDQYTITVIYFEGRSACESVSKGARLDDDEILSLLIANKGDGGWKEKEAILTIDRTWNNEDAGRVAVYSAIERRLEFATLAHHQRLAEAEAARLAAEKAEKEKLRGF